VSVVTSRYAAIFCRNLLSQLHWSERGIYITDRQKLIKFLFDSNWLSSFKYWKWPFHV